MNTLQEKISDILNNPQKYVRQSEKDDKIILSSVVEYEYVYTGGKWDTFSDYSEQEVKTEKYLTKLFQKIYNDSNIKITVQAECSRGSLRNKIRIKIDSLFGLEMENVSMINQLLLIAAIFVGVNGTIYIYNNIKKEMLTIQYENEKSLENFRHENNLEVLKTKHEYQLEIIKANHEYIIKQAQKSNLSQDNVDKLKKVMDSSFTSELLEKNENIELKKLSAIDVADRDKENFYKSINIIVKNQISVEDFVKRFKDYQREEAKELLYEQFETMDKETLKKCNITPEEWNGYLDAMERQDTPDDNDDNRPTP